MFNAPQFDILRKQILAEFSGRKTTVEDIGEFVVAHTAFRETHFKVQVLKPLEALKDWVGWLNIQTEQAALSSACAQ